MTTQVSKESSSLPLTVIGEQYFMDEDEPTTNSGITHDIKLDSESYIFAFTGRRGGGKTTSMSYHAAKCMTLFNQRILSNYPIQFMFRRSDGRCYPLKSEALDLYKLLCFDNDYKNCVICIDEAPDIVSHMASMTWKNRLLNIFVRELRKNRNTLMLAAQDFMLLDKSMRWQVDVIVECEDAYRKYGPSFQKGALILERWKDSSGMWTGEPWEQALKRANARGLYGDEGDWCEDCELISTPMWGQPGKTLPLFDTYYQQDIWESLKKVDMHLSSYSVGDQSEGQQQQGADNPFTLAASLIQSVKENSNGIIPSTHFYGAIPGITKVQKDKLSKAIAKLPGIDKKKNKNAWQLDFSHVNPADLGGLL
jgi:hypothetical protein